MRTLLQRLGHLVATAISIEMMTVQQFSDVLATAGYTDLSLSSIVSVEVKENERSKSHHIVVTFEFDEEGVCKTGKVFGFMNVNDLVVWDF